MLTNTLSLAGRRTRVLVATFLVALCALAALAIGGAAPADAAGPNRLYPGDTVTYPTWGWGATQLCAANENASSWGRVGVSPYGNAYESFWVPPGSTACISRWWYGNYVKVINIGSTVLRTWTS